MSKKFDPIHNPLTERQILAWIKKHPRARFESENARFCPLATIIDGEHFVRIGKENPKGVVENADSLFVRYLSDFEKRFVVEFDRLKVSCGVGRVREVLKAISEKKPAKKARKKSK